MSHWELDLDGAMEALGEQLLEDARQMRPVITGTLAGSWQPGDEINYGYTEVGAGRVYVGKPGEDGWIFVGEIVS